MDENTEKRVPMYLLEIMFKESGKRLSLNLNERDALETVKVLGEMGGLKSRIDNEFMRMWVLVSF